MNPNNNNLPQNQFPVADPSPGSNQGSANAFMDVRPPTTQQPNTPAFPPVSAPPIPTSSNEPTPDSTPPKKPKRNHDGWRSVISTVLVLAIAPLIALGITAFAIQSYQVDGASMETTLQNQDRLIVDKLPRSISRVTGNPYIPNRGDIIIFNQADLPNSAFGEQKQLIKRVIGLPGDHVVVSDGSIKIYNQKNPSGFNPDETVGYKITSSYTSGDVDITLEENQVFVCGDNRPNSEDSRYFGPVNSNEIVGKLVLRLLPLDKAQRF